MRSDVLAGQQRPGLPRDTFRRAVRRAADRGESVACRWRSLPRRSSNPWL